MASVSIAGFDFSLNCFVSSFSYHVTLISRGLSPKKFPWSFRIQQTANLFDICYHE